MCGRGLSLVHATLFLTFLILISIVKGWAARQSARGLVLTREVAAEREAAVGTDCDPVYLEVFNNLFMSIAEQMGFTLQSTAYSVNIKERLDFSCAVFDAAGDLIANWPSDPFHKCGDCPNGRTPSAK